MIIWFASSGEVPLLSRTDKQFFLFGLKVLEYNRLLSFYCKGYVLEFVKGMKGEFNADQS